MHNKKKRGASGGGGFASAALQSLATKTFPYAGPLRPGKQSPQRIVLEENVLVKPDYWQTGTPSRASKPLLPWMIEVKTADEIQKMRQSGALARRVLDLAGRMVRAGITTDAIDARVHQEIIAVRRMEETRE
jgi:methionyl aminopeptidase